jgi:hypothetical protein
MKAVSSLDPKTDAFVPKHPLTVETTISTREEALLEIDEKEEVLLENDEDLLEKLSSLSDKLCDRMRLITLWRALGISSFKSLSISMAPFGGASIPKVTPRLRGKSGDGKAESDEVDDGTVGGKASDRKLDEVDDGTVGGKASDRTASWGKLDTVDDGTVGGKASDRTSSCETLDPVDEGTAEGTASDRTSCAKLDPVDEGTAEGTASGELGSLHPASLGSIKSCGSLRRLCFDLRADSGNVGLALGLYPSLGG